MVFEPTRFYIQKAQKMLEFARIGLKLSSCLKLDNWIVDFSLDSGPEWYFKFDKLNFWYKMDELLFEIIYFVLNTSIKWVRSLSIYLIACMYGWIVFYTNVRKGKYGFLNLHGFIFEKLKRCWNLPELDWNYQVVLNLIVELSTFVG